MSLMGRAFHSAGKAVSDMANRYIDEEMQRNRAEFMADLQRRTAGAIREDDDRFKNDPTRLVRDRENKRQDLLSAGSAAREAELAALNDATYQGAKAAAADRDAASAGRRKIDAEKAELSDSSLMTARRQRDADNAAAKADSDAAIAKRQAADKAYIDAQRAIKLADPEVEARIKQSQASAAASWASAGNSSAHAATAKQQADALKRVNDIYGEMLRVSRDKTMPDEQRAKELQRLQSEVQMLSGGGKSSGAQEYDTVEKTTKSIDPKTGEEVTTKETSKRRPSLMGGGSEDPTQKQATALQEALKAGKGPEIVKQMEADGRSPAQIVALVGRDEYAKVKGAAGQKPSAAPALETTTTPQGKTVYRLKGQTQWQPTKEAAMAAASPAPARAAAVPTAGEEEF